ncbi:rhomboid family intramembrane serine protease [Blastopirellula sp. J2-11]|uniref:rhomboid family intramembrane serine protease n=1 Tax=Blastopirellula sp. J2-11 TaxID=2943192 RepID=UPI0021CA8292|nr:rhomboid family intramembrane serine protease [Blastopirellula sp. J2-11]UUO04326.1 rhomboid family intramembrane serine protease [Blastopirellula sp. J2-11]
MDALTIQIPFTLAVLVALIVAAIWTNTHRAEIAPSDLNDWGYAPRHLPALQWRRIFTSLFFTVGGWRFYVSLIATGLFLGSLESKLGSLRAASLFLGVHLLTLCCESFLIVPPLRYLRLPLGDILHITQDVGPSAGYYGCFGAILLLNHWPAAIISLVALFLLLRVVVNLLLWGASASSLPADIAHMIAFSLGIAAGFWLLA